VGGTAFPVAFSFGWYIAGFQQPSGGAGRRQSWLGTDMNARRQISVALAGTPLDSGCGPAAVVP
jgi:hypothetical protein